MILSLLSFLFAVLSFYLFRFIDGFLLLLFSSQYIICRVIGQGARKISKRNLMHGHSWLGDRTTVLFYCMLGLFLGYLAGLRFSISNINLSTVADVNTRMDTSLSASARNVFLNIYAFLFRKYPVDVAAEVFMSKLGSYMSKDSASLIVALIVGRKEYLHLALSDLVRRNGISHLLALSGFHLSLLIICVEYVFLGISKFFYINKKIKSLSMVFFVVLYCLWIGFIPSLYRAALMYIISLLIRYYFGSAKFLLVWSMTGLTMLGLYPAVMFEHGYILSMLALLGVMGGVYFSRYFCKYVPTIIATPLSVGLGAFLFTAWYSYVFFGATYPIGLMSSVIFTPVVTLCMVLGIVLLLLLKISSYVVVFDFFISFFATLIGKFLDLLVQKMIYVMAYMSRIIVLDSVFDIVMCYLLVAILLLLGRRIFRVQ